MLLGLNISDLHSVHGSVYRNLFGAQPKHAWYHVADALRTSYPLRFESFARSQHLHDDALFYQFESLSCVPTSIVRMPNLRKQQAQGDGTESCFSRVTSVDDVVQDSEIGEQHIELGSRPDFDEQDAHNNVNSDASDSEDEQHSKAAALFVAEHERQLQEETFFDTSSEYDNRFWHEDVFWDASETGESASTPLIQSVDKKHETQTESGLTAMHRGSVRAHAPDCEQEVSAQESINNDAQIPADEVSLPEKNQIDILLPHAELGRPISQENTLVQIGEEALPVTDNTIAPWAQVALEKQPVTEPEVAQDTALYDEIDGLEAERTVREALVEDEEKNVKFKPINEFGPQKKELSELERYFMNKRLARFLHEQLDAEVVGSLQGINKQ